MELAARFDAGAPIRSGSSAMPSYRGIGLLRGIEVVDYNPTRLRCLDYQAPPNSLSGATQHIRRGCNFLM